MIHVPAVVLGQVFALGVCRKIARRLTSSGEALVIALALQAHLSPSHSKHLVYAVSQQFFVPALLTKGTRFLTKLFRGRQAFPLLSGSDEGNEKGADTQSGGGKKRRRGMPLPAVPAPLSPAASASISTVELSERYSEWVELAQQMLASKDIVLPSTYDVDGLEVTRFLVANGMKHAANERDATAVLAKAVPAIQDQLAWWSTYRFCSPEELDAWGDVIWWDAPDAEGHMSLVLHATRAVTRLSATQGAGEACLRALVSLLELGVRQPPSLPLGPPLMPRPTSSHSQLGAVAENSQVAGQQKTAADATRLPDKIVVRVVCTGTNTRQALKLVPLLRRTAQLMAAAYPTRLRRLYLVDMPSTMWLTFKAIMMLMRRDTRDKVQVVKASKMPPLKFDTRATTGVAPSGGLRSTNSVSAMALLEGRPWPTGATSGPAMGSAAPEQLTVSGASGLFIIWMRALLVLTATALLTGVALQQAVAQWQMHA